MKIPLLNKNKSLIYFKKNNIVERYASIFLYQAIKNGVLQSIKNDIFFLKNQFKNHPTLNSSLNNPTISRSHKHTLLKKIFYKQLNPILWIFIKLIIDQHKIGLLKEILNAFYIAYNVYMEIQYAILVTSIPLPELLIKRIKKEVRKWVPCKKVLMEQKIDPSIIGGYILQIGTLQLDRTIKNYLHNMQNSLY